MHRDLLAAYPALAQVQVKLELGERRRGCYWPEVCTGGAPRIEVEAPDMTAARLAVLHELQHAVQELEGFELGALPTIDRRYPFLAGEAEARATVARADLAAEERRATFPLDSYDVPLERIVLGGIRRAA